VENTRLQRRHLKNCRRTATTRTQISQAGPRAQNTTIRSEGRWDRAASKAAITIPPNQERNRQHREQGQQIPEGHQRRAEELAGKDIARSQAAEEQQTERLLAPFLGENARREPRRLQHQVTGRQTQKLVQILARLPVAPDRT
jgi:hypothetical protein